MNKEFKEYIDKNNDKVTGSIGIKALCPDREAIDALLGPEVLSCLPISQPPCIKPYTCGTCQMPASHFFCSHAVTKAPSKEALKGVLTQVKAHVNTLVQMHLKFSPCCRPLNHSRHTIPTPNTPP